ncbi:MAG: peptide deformylase [Candidatus Pacebacteria bacterium]|nr:peptide deformylase [Candidatus Paceibacterota bacterium]MBP9818566.1 peptide deformylase [Candidatus Paceibacterota bacterium]
MSPAKKTQSNGFIPAIVSEGHPALRAISEEIPLSEISSAKIQNLITDMKKALASQEDGIGLAAPQIGVPLRIFIVSKKIFSSHGPSSEQESENDTTKSSAKSAKIDDLVFINPVLTKESKEKKWMEGEGCLSVRWVYGKVRRSTKVTIRAYDENGRVFERGAGGLLAHIFQHEVDHLNGLLFIDKAKDIEEVDPKEVKAHSKKTNKPKESKK